jgi:hypothetical protein
MEGKKQPLIDGNVQVRFLIFGFISFITNEKEVSIEILNRMMIVFNFQMAFRIVRGKKLINYCVKTRKLM